MIALYIGAILLLVLASAFFSGSETAITAVSRAKIHKLKSSGHKKATIVYKLRADKDGLISTILLGNTAINIIASSLGTIIATEFLGNQGIIYSSVIMTLIILIFAEVLPKTYAFYNAEKVSLLIAPLLYWIVRISTPITLAVKSIVNMILRITRVSKDNKDLISPKDELRGAIDMYHDEGRVVKHDRDMLSSVLDLQYVEVRDVMVHRKNIVSIDSSLPIDKIMEQILESSFTRIPLWSGRPENIIGIINTKAVLLRFYKNPNNLTKDDILSDMLEPWFVPDSSSIGNQLLKFRQKQTHMALVVNEYGDLAGLVTLEDILEEIVGDIDDEHDIVLKDIKRTNKKGTYIVHGDVTVRDINRELGWNLPDKHAVTISGLLVHKLEYLPLEGEEGNIGDVHFRIIKKDGHIISRIRLAKIIKK